MLWPLIGSALGLSPGWLAMLIMGVEGVTRIVVVGVIPGGRRPDTAPAWLLAIFLVPPHRSAGVLRVWHQPLAAEEPEAPPGGHRYRDNAFRLMSGVP